MSFQPGDIVVRKWSKASTLKGKIFKVLGEVPKPPNASYYGHSTKVRVAAPNGSQKEIYEYRLRKIEDELKSAESESERRGRQADHQALEI